MRPGYAYTKEAIMNPLYPLLSPLLPCPCGCGAVAPATATALKIAFLGVAVCDHRRRRLLPGKTAVFCDDCQHTLFVRRSATPPFPRPQVLWVSQTWWQIARRSL